MAKGANDVILRDRLQFDIDANGDTALVYGRIDLSDYVSIVENKGLAIKEVRFQLRTGRAPNVGVWPNVMSNLTPAGLTNTYYDSRVKIFATTTAYELVHDVGIASPNVLCVFEKQSTVVREDTTGTAIANPIKPSKNTPIIQAPVVPTAPTTAPVTAPVIPANLPSSS